MNIGSSPFRKTLGSIAATAISSLLSTTVLAGPNQLDILGLVPGVSEPPQVKQAGVDPNSNSKESVMLEIGGYKIPCALSFLNGKLASLTCLTGEGTEEYEQYTKASNTEVHSTLTAGFTKKFGKPDSVNREPVRTRMGVEYEQQFVTWKDKRGNKLQLISMADTVNMGLITFESSEYLKEEAEKNAAEEARKKF
jgi:hypothetical protein